MKKKNIKKSKPSKRAKASTPSIEYVFSDELNQRLQQYQGEVVRLLNKLSVATQVVSGLCELRAAAKKGGKR